MNISQSLIIWYDKNKRDLPWRDTNDPYKIWLSEIILQQTRVDQGLKYYLSFVKNFPTIFDLATASEEDVLKLWQGLGYYSRARNLHATAKKIVDEYNGKFPGNYNDIIKLKGIGEYTAAAIVSFCYNDPYPVIDGNVLRVISRLFHIQMPIDQVSTKMEIKYVLNEILDRENAGIFNQAIMEFGALQCVPKNPDCTKCPLADLCISYQKNMVNQIPIKGKKVKTRNRFFNYLVILDGEHVYLNKRDKNDIWKNLYEFPLIETTEDTNPEELIQLSRFTELFKENDIIISESGNTIKHILSHQVLSIRFIRIKMKKSSLLLPDKYLRIPLHKIKSYPVPVVIGNFIDEVF